MTKFKVGDKIIHENGSTTTIVRIVDTRLYGDWVTKDGVIYRNNYNWDHKCSLIKPKIQVGSTYLTPTGLKRKVVFTDEHGSLTDNSDGPNTTARKWFPTKVTNSWTLVPPEEWVNINRNSPDVSPSGFCISSKYFASEQEARDDIISGINSRHYVRTVRVDENYNTSSV